MICSASPIFSFKYVFSAHMQVKNPCPAVVLAPSKRAHGFDACSAQIGLRALRGALKVGSGTFILVGPETTTLGVAVCAYTLVQRKLKTFDSRVAVLLNFVSAAGRALVCFNTM